MMRETARSAIIVIGGIVLVAALVFGYNMMSTNAIQALHNRYDTIIEAHVLIPPATASTPGQGHVSEIFTLDVTSVDFGTVSPGAKSDIKSLKIGSTGVIQTMYVHVATDLNTPGVTLVTSETTDITVFNKRAVSAVGTTYPMQLIAGGSKTPGFQIEVDPNTAGKDITFHIIISYSYLPP